MEAAARGLYKSHKFPNSHLPHTRSPPGRPTTRRQPRNVSEVGILFVCRFVAVRKALLVGSSPRRTDPTTRPLKLTTG